MVMMMKYMQIILFLCIAPCMQVTASTCNVPSRFWCDSQEIALACGVYDQCRNFDRSLPQGAAPVNFTLYYESLCPYSKNFMTTKLYPTFLKISSIINLSFVPYGNAQARQVGNSWAFQCQHGPNECVGNILSTCTIDIVKDVNVYFPFLNCIESSILTPAQASKQCAYQFPVPLDQILNCTTSDYGNQLQHQMAASTDSLVPQHTYVPWVTLNGVHTEDIQNEALTNLLKLICDTYTGQKPSACPKN